MIELTGEKILVHQHGRLLFYLSPIDVNLTIIEGCGRETQRLRGGLNKGYNFGIYSQNYSVGFSLEMQTQEIKFPSKLPL